jgi:hypothetical protein
MASSNTCQRPPRNGLSLSLSNSSREFFLSLACSLFPSHPGNCLVTHRQMSFQSLTKICRWLAQHRSRSAASQALVKLRCLPQGHPYLEEELSCIMETVDNNRDRFGEGGLISQLKELRTPSNRKRIAIGVAIFIFMQFAGSNAINYYRSAHNPFPRGLQSNFLHSPRIFKSVGLTGSSTSLYATGIYGIVRLVCVIIAMHFVVDRFGRKKMLMGGAAVMAIAMVSIHSLLCWGTVELLLTCDISSGTLAPTSRSPTQLRPAASPQEDTLPSPSFTSLPLASASRMPASLGFYVPNCSPCTSVVSAWYVSSINHPKSYPRQSADLDTPLGDLHSNTLALQLRDCTIRAIHDNQHRVSEDRFTSQVLNSVANRLHSYGTYFVFASFTTLSIVFVYFCVPETRGLTLEQVDILFEGPPHDVTDITIEEGKVIEGSGIHVERSERSASASK